MPLFNIARCKDENIPSTIQDGYVYMSIDGNYIYMDWVDDQGNSYRFSMNAESSKKIKFVDSNGNIVELEGTTIADHLNNTENPHNLTKEQLGLGVATLDEVVSYIGI